MDLRGSGPARHTARMNVCPISANCILSDGAPGGDLGPLGWHTLVTSACSQCMTYICLLRMAALHLVPYQALCEVRGGALLQPQPLFGLRTHLRTVS